MTSSVVSSSSDKHASFEHVNRIKRLHFILQALLAIGFILGVNYLASHYFLRSDLSRQRRYTLSAETQARIKQIDPREPVTITVSLAPERLDANEQQLFRHIRSLLKEYAYYGSRGGEERIRLRFIDLYQDRQEAERLRSQYNINEPRLILIESGERHRTLLEDDLVTLEDKVLSTFKGEQALTRAILEVIQAEATHLYFTQGHGEMQWDDLSPQRGLSLLRAQLELRNFDLHTLDLAEVATVPDDTDLLIIAGPRGPFQGEDVAKIDRYLDQDAGRVIILVDPGYSHGLEELLFNWGLRVDDMTVIETQLDSIAATGDLRVRRFARHPITAPLIAQKIPVLVSLAQPVRKDPNAPQDDRLAITYPLTSSKNSWAERAWRENKAASFDPRTDLPGPVPLVAIAERKASPELGLDVRGGRLTVLGSSNFIANQRMSHIGNYSLIYSILNWNLDQQKLLGISPQRIERFQLTLSRRQKWRLALLFLAVPAATALLGGFVLWLRRA